MPMFARLPKGSIDQPIAGCADPSMTVLRLLQEMRAVRMKDSQFYREAEIRERIILGEQTPEYDPTLLQVVAPPYDLRAPMHENVILPAVQTLVARTDQGRIDAKCWPHTPTAARIAAAEGGNLLLDAERAREHRDMKVHESLFWAIVHGESGVYTVWDESYGPIEAVEQIVNPADGLPTFDPATGLPATQMVEEYGGIRTEVLSTFDFWTSGEDDPGDTRWQVRRRIVDKWTAKAALARAGIDRDPQEKSHDTNSAAGPGRRRTGVEVFEMWVKKGPMVGPGLTAIVVDDCTVVNGPFAFKHGRLPISTLTFMRQRGSPHGHTVAKDAIAQQRLINVALRSILRRADIAGDARLVGADEIIEGIDSEREGRIRYNGVKAVQDAAIWLTGAEIPQGLVAVYQLAKAALNAVVGVSEESVSGGDPSSTSSGEQLKTASALDSQKTVPLRRRAEYAWEEVDRQKIELFREKASLPRLIAVTGDAMRAMYLQGADLDGVDVAIEGASGLAESHAGKVRAAEEGAAAGYTQPGDAAEMRQTGSGQTILDAETMARVQKQGMDALRGMPQQPLPGIDGSAAARALRTLLGQVQPGRSNYLVQLIAAYEQQTAMGQMSQMQGASAGVPGAPKPSITPTSKTMSSEIPQGAIQ